VKITADLHYVVGEQNLDVTIILYV